MKKVRIMPIIISGLKKKYRSASGFKSNPVLSDFNLTINTGESFGFLGPNGAGKSTIIKTLMNFIHSDEGTLTIDGKKVDDYSVRRKIGYLPEQPLFYDHLSAEEILRFGGQISSVPAAILKDRIDDLLERMQLSNVKKKPIRAYSKGMNQRVGLALAMIHDPDICILDEPMSGLDPMGRKLVTDFILDIRKAGKTVFFSSHILSDVERLCDRVGVLNKGKLLFCGPLDEFKNITGDIERSFVEMIDGDNKVSE